MLKFYNIYGLHASLAALNNPSREIKQIACTPHSFNEHKELITKFNHRILSEKDLQDLAKTSHHQGLVVTAAPVMQQELNDLDNVTKIVILDQITDPQNFGAILRSAAAFEFDVIIIPKNNSVEENATVAKTSSGGLELVKIVQVVNISRTIEDLKKLGFWVMGLDINTKDTIHNLPDLKKIVAIIGSEGNGIRPLVKNNCDFLVKIPMSTKMESLNASNAAAIFFNAIYQKLSYTN
ncbi:MAG: 23S rRNA (guanosine(2251)-2'-O)-methyltransferase RlmB [Rickettsiaceae bacterium]|nr:23S rRNA (guanosine(2251)-2'-O)-methyltransferase RlmB [Rickettsiaceae bacterium]